MNLPMFEESNTKGAKGKDLTIFVRFGGLDLKNQMAFGKKTFHSPPASRGIYAMPKVAQELFLTGSISDTQPDNFPKYPKYPGTDPNVHDDDFDAAMIKFREETKDVDYDKLHKRTDKVRQNMRREFKKIDGNIWHHMQEFTPNVEVIARHGAWIKTSMYAWRKAFSKATLKRRYGEKRESGWDLSTKSINSPVRSGLSGMYSKDEFEVFFDEKV